MDKLKYITKNKLLTLITFLLLGSSPAFSTTITVINEDFNDVSGLTLPGSVRTMADILANNPEQLPNGTYSGGPSGSVNVRRADNTINTSTGTSGFDSFFTPATSANKFLVLGDNTGTIGDAPTSGMMNVNFPFSLSGATTSVTVSFKYAFDGIDTVTANDIFSVTLIDGSTVTLLNISSPNNRPSGSAGNIATGIFSQTFLMGDLPSYDLELVFSLTENLSASTNTAIGIDDVKITAVVPEPGTLLLLGAGLIGLGLYGRKKIRG